MAKKKESFPNCFEISRFGEPQVGIALALDPGHDPLRPIPQRVVTGHRYIMLDSRAPAPVADGKVMSAELGQTGNAVKVLSAPQTTRPQKSIIKIDFTLPGKKSAIMVQGFPVRVYTGFSGGRLIEKGPTQVLVELVEGERLSVFYEDGAVRQWIRQGPALEERFLLNEDEVLTARITQAKRLIEQVKNQPQAFDFVKAVTLGMVDLLRFTALFDKKGVGQAMRLRLLREFFLELPLLVRQLVWGVLGTAVKAVDPALCHVLYAPCERPAATVTDIAVRRSEVEALSLEERAARRAANIARDQAAREAKAARQATFKAARQARAVVKPKEGKNKKKAA